MSHIYKPITQTNSKIKDLVITALLTALVFVATRFINFTLPISISGGLVHMGNTMLFTAAIVFGARKGAIAGAFGMGLFDIVSGWAPWAPFTFVIRGLMGLIIGSMANIGGRSGKNVFLNLSGIVLASILMVAGYYATEGLLYSNWIAPVTSIPGNLLQLAFGTIVAIPLSAALKKAGM